MIPKDSSKNKFKYFRRNNGHNRRNSDQSSGLDNRRSKRQDSDDYDESDAFR